MKNKASYAVILASLFAMSFNSFGQHISGKQLLGSKNQGFEAVLKRLHHLQILQGQQYKYFYPSIRGHQYWDKAIYAIGSLTFEEVTYQNILLNYDVHNDLVLMPVVRNGLTENITLDKARIDNFQVGSAYFVNIQDTADILTPGIYNLAFAKNEVQLYIQTKKSVAGNNQQGGQLNKFVEENTLLLLLEGVVHQIENRKDLFKALETRPSLVNYIKNDNLKLRNQNQMKTSLPILFERFYSSNL